MTSGRHKALKPTERDARALAMRRAGLPLSDIGRVLGVSEQRISYVVSQWAPDLMKGRRYPHTPQTIAQVRTLWDTGLSTAKIGHRLGMTKNAVIGIAHRNDFPARPSPIP